jgi:hypothetical protein
MKRDAIHPDCIQFMNDSIKRRLDADEIDFSGFKDYDLKITDPEFEVEMVLSLMY